MVAFFPTVSAADGTADGSVRISIDGTEYVLPPAAARRLRDDIREALSSRAEFVHTAGEHRADGSYVIERRAADSPGNRVTFESFDALRAVYDGLPDRFTARDVERDGVTGSRRHLLVRHLAEHPAFNCSLTCENPLTAEKE